MEKRLDTGALRGCLEDYLRQKGIATRKPFRCLSPDHEDRHPSMSYNRTGQNVHCFACGVTYDLFDLVGMDYGLESFSRQVEKAAELFGVAVPSVDKLKVVYGTGKEKKEFPGKYRKKTAPPVVGQDRSAEWAEIAGKDTGSRAYFYGRGIDGDSCRRFGLIQTEDRAWFPLIHRGKVTGWCGRALAEDDQPRYKNSQGALDLWNGDRLREQGGGKVLCVAEGIVDAILLEQSGYPAVALCGSQNVGKLVREIEASPETANTWRFLVCGDGDEAGRRMNQVLEDKLSALGLSVQVLALPDGADVADLYHDDSQALAERIRSAQGGEEDAAAAYAATSAAGALDGFFQECERRGGKEGIATGFPVLDKLLDGGLHTGLYVLGAISSLGKTSLALQMADYIAEHERDVLFVTLEQSRSELMAKSISRISAELDSEGAFTVRELLGGGAFANLLRRDLLRECRAVYAAGAGSLFFREGLCDIAAADIREMVRAHLAHRGQAPVVVVDYLQILRPADPRATDKQNVDRSVVELKRLSRDFDVPVLAVSSFNRENYKAAVSMEAFKESGAVEYSADVLLGLQLAGAGDRGFDVNAAKLKAPRELELVILKNRSGLPYAKVPLAYDARYSGFRERGRVAASRLA